MHTRRRTYVHAYVHTFHLFSFGLASHAKMLLTVQGNDVTGKQLRLHVDRDFGQTILVYTIVV